MQREHSGASQPTSPTYVDSCSTSAAVGVSLLPLRAPPTPLHNNIDPHFNVQSSHEAGFAITIGRARLCAPSRPCRCSRSRSRTMLLVGTRTPRQILQSKPSPHRNSRFAHATWWWPHRQAREVRGRGKPRCREAVLPRSALRPHRGSPKSLHLGNPGHHGNSEHPPRVANHLLVLVPVSKPSPRRPLLRSS